MGDRKKEEKEREVYDHGDVQGKKRREGFGDASGKKGRVANPKGSVNIKENRTDKEDLHRQRAVIQRRRKRAAIVRQLKWDCFEGGVNALPRSKKKREKT